MPPAPASTRSPLLARALLLAACGAGLAGLAVPGHSSTHRTLSASVSTTPAMATPIEIEPRAPHAVPAPAPVVAHRASRSRTVAVSKAKAKASKPAVTGRWVRPSGAGIISSFGPRWGRLHKGLDFSAGFGAPIYAIGDGVVVGTGYQSGESGYGLITIIRHSNGVFSAYAHQSRYVVRVGDRVTAGQVIGFVGATGEVTGAHLHFEIRNVEHGGQINPLPWLRAHGVSL